MQVVKGNKSGGGSTKPLKTKSTTKKTAPSKAGTHTGGTTARKSVPKKTAAPSATRVDDRAPDSEPIPSTQPAVVIDDSVTKVAEQILRKSRRWGSGSDRDDRLKRAGYDVEAVRREVRRLRHAQLTS
jgi:hypothetical protein